MVNPSEGPPLPPHSALRALTYLAPSLPLRLFELVCIHVGRALDRAVVLETELRSSGPMHGDVDPFQDRAEPRADLGFLCSPSYLWLSSRPCPSVELVPAAFVFNDPRAAGAPLYFSDVVVRVDHPANRFTDLEGSVWGFNDECSLSGYFATQQELAALGCSGDFFARRERTGSHLASLEALLSGRIDGAAIDSTALLLARRARPELDAGLRVIASFGPFPVQPLVVRSGLAPFLREGLAEALLSFGETGEGVEARARFGLESFARVSDADYDAERDALRGLGMLP